LSDLNIWAPAKSRGKRAVVVWIHGGGFNEGSGSVPIYNGAALAGRDLVVVTINYRLGALGFLAHRELTKEAGDEAASNFGIQDQIAALTWVRQNIASFGGDPDNVTIAGQSAGAMAVHTLVSSPLAKGLFARAIAQSGLPTIMPVPDLAVAESAGAAFAQQLRLIARRTAQASRRKICDVGIVNCGTAVRCGG
jgi:para-nitrobenzyl esterase